MITNPADTGEIFRSTKSGLRSLARGGFGTSGHEYVPSESLSLQIDGMFEALRVFFREKLQKSMPHDWSSHKCKLKEALLRIHRVMCKCLTKLNVRIGFEVAAQCKINGRFDLVRLLKQIRGIVILKRSSIILLIRSAMFLPQL